MEDYFDEKYIIRSASLIQFITNGLPCYIKLKNYATGMYLKIIDDIICGDVMDGNILIMKPDYTQNNVSFTILDNDKFKNNKIASYPTNSIVKIHNDDKKTSDTLSLDTQFYLYGKLNEIKIYSCNQNRNMFGNNGRFMFMSDDGYVHADGGNNMDCIKWQIIKINDPIQYTDCRNDCIKLNKEIALESKKNLEGLFPNIIKHVTFLNISCNKYLQVLYQENPNNNSYLPSSIGYLPKSIGYLPSSIGYLQKSIGYDNKLIGSDEKNKFILRPVQDENCVYISQYYNGRYINIYTQPRKNNTLMGAPDCNWAKFYIIKRKEHYLFQCFHRESDPEGGYGRYLCMIQENENEDKYTVLSNGSEKDEKSMWKLI
jgi:hypothetical protein